MTPVRWGFLGAGFIATRALAPAVHAAEGAVLHHVSARDSGRAAALGPAGPASNRYEAVLADPDVEVVYVALPNDQHLPWTLAALAAGKHVLCEKPMGLDAGQVRQIRVAATAAGRLAVEATWYRWHPRTIRSRDLLRGGLLGEPVSMSVAFCFGNVPEGNYRLDPARGGGAWYDVGCYGVSAAHLLLGSELAVAHAEQRLGPTGVDLETRARLGNPTGAVADVVASIDAAENQDVTVQCTEGTLTWSAPQLTSWREPATLTITRPDADPVVERFAAIDAYRLMVEQVSACVRGDGEPVVDLTESLRVAVTMDSVVAAAGPRGAAAATRGAAATQVATAPVGC